MLQSANVMLVIAWTSQHLLETASKMTIVVVIKILGFQNEIVDWATIISLHGLQNNSQRIFLTIENLTA